jgi:hypothetical protein
MLGWGATDEEVRGALPGDDVIKQPRYQATHAVTVHAPDRRRLALAGADRPGPRRPVQLRPAGEPVRGDPAEAYEQGLPWSSWTFVLRDRGDATTRLIARLRADFKPTAAGLLVDKHGLEPVHFLMERKMLLGIRQRAERAGASA